VIGSSNSPTLYDSTVDEPLTTWHASQNGPKTHALIIGVGDYLHLPGGQGRQVEDFVDFQQLTSAPISARDFAQWMLDEFHNSSAPLGSVELLLSPPDPFVLSNGVVRHPCRATMEEIRLAFARWKDRCDTSEKNIAVFYFCGHGLQRESLALLAEDFGAHPYAPFQNAIDLNRTWQGMGRCKAGAQYYFIDSCRETKWSLGRNLVDPAAPLIEAHFAVKHYRDAPIFMATTPGKSAYGMTGQRTVFTGALFESLRRGAAKIGGNWVITSHRLAEALASELKAVSQTLGDIQHSCLEGTMSGSVFHELKEAPEVKVALCCQPESATAKAHLEMCDARAPQLPKYRRPKPEPHPWELKATAGVYVARARFVNSHLSAGELDLWVMPPGPVDGKVPVGP